MCLVVDDECVDGVDDAVAGDDVRADDLVTVDVFAVDVSGRVRCGRDGGAFCEVADGKRFTGDDVAVEDASEKTGVTVDDVSVERAEVVERCVGGNEHGVWGGVREPVVDTGVLDGGTELGERPVTFEQLSGGDVSESFELVAGCDRVTCGAVWRRDVRLFVGCSSDDDSLVEVVGASDGCDSEDEGCDDTLVGGHGVHRP